MCVCVCVCVCVCAEAKAKPLNPAAYFTTKHALGRIFTLQNNVNSNDDVENNDGCEDAAMLVMTMMMKMQLCALLKYSETCIEGRFTQTKSAPKRRQ